MTKVATKVEPRRSGEQAALPARRNPFEALHQEVDRLFDRFSAPRGWFGNLWGAWEPSFAAPPIDVVEKDNVFEVSVELPGMSADDIDVTASDGTLTIRGEKSEASEEKKARYYLSERSFGAFERSLALPRGIDVDNIAADYKNGVLRITLPKTAGACERQHRVEIKAA